MNEYSYEIDKYIVGVDNNGEDGIGLTIATMKDNELHILGSCYGDNARFIDLLIKENQELKLELSGYRQAILEDKDMLGLKEKNQELEKQLTTYQILHRDCNVDNLKNISKIEEMENQQKKFIEYMNKTMEECNNYSKYIEKKTKELHGRSYGKTYIANEIMKNEVAKKILKETLSKYRKIIGE